MPRRRPQGSRGAAAVEMALVAPLLMAVVLGAVDFGWWSFETHEVTGAARDGARRAQVVDRASLDVVGGAGWRAVDAAARSRVTYGPGLLTTVRCVTPTGAPLACAAARTDTDRVQVTVAWTSPSLTYVLGVGGRHSLTSTTTSTLVGSPG